jgi:ubiquinone biosynthesis monooxygenase Coq7
MIDNLIIELDKFVKTIFANPVSERPHPDAKVDEAQLSDADKNQAISLMRVNHCGEVCAQALYQGQAITSHNDKTKAALSQAAAEETEHLAWTKKRINELGGKTSILNPLFYLGSLTIGMTAGLIGDKWNLGFLKATEEQVEAHLNDHLEKINPNDTKSRAILEQMREDEIRHAEMATNQGASDLPLPVKLAMKIASKIMTKTTYYI